VSERNPLNRLDDIPELASSRPGEASENRAGTSIAPPVEAVVEAADGARLDGLSEATRDGPPAVISDVRSELRTAASRPEVDLRSRWHERIVHPLGAVVIDHDHRLRARRRAACRRCHGCHSDETEAARDEHQRFRGNVARNCALLSSDSLVGRGLGQGGLAEAQLEDAVQRVCRGS